jgi:predicted NAD/FAD-binding protein
VRRRSNTDGLPERFDEALAAVMEYGALTLLAGLLAALAATFLREVRARSEAEVLA